MYDNYGIVTLSPAAPSSGAGVSTRSPVSGVPGGDIDLIAPLGTIDASEAGINSGANVNLAALHIVNAANIQAQGNTTGLTDASNTASAASQAETPECSANNAQPSIIIVEVLGFGGEGGSSEEEEKRRHSNDKKQSYNPESVLQVVRNGVLTPEQTRALTEEERRSAAQ